MKSGSKAVISADVSKDTIMTNSKNVFQGVSTIWRAC